MYVKVWIYKKLEKTKILNHYSAKNQIEMIMFNISDQNRKC